MLRDHWIFCWRKKRGGFGFRFYVSNSTNLRELLGGICQSWNLSEICFEIYPDIDPAEEEKTI